MFLPDCMVPMSSSVVASHSADDLLDSDVAKNEEFEYCTTEVIPPHSIWDTNIPPDGAARLPEMADLRGLMTLPGHTRNFNLQSFGPCKERINVHWLPSASIKSSISQYHDSKLPTDCRMA